MSKKKSKSNTLIIIGVFLIVLGGLMIYNTYVSGNKGLITSAVFSIIIGGVLFYVSKKSVKRRRK